MLNLKNKGLTTLEGIDYPNNITELDCCIPSGQYWSEVN